MDGCYNVALGGGIVAKTREEAGGLGVEEGLDVSLEMGLMAGERKEGGCWRGGCVCHCRENSS